MEMIVGVISDLASLGAAGVMGAMWLWERRSSQQREEQLTESHGRIVRDEERLTMLTQVVEQNTAAIARFNETQRETCETIKTLVQEMHNGRNGSGS